MRLHHDWWVVFCIEFREEMFEVGVLVATELCVDNRLPASQVASEAFLYIVSGPPRWPTKRGSVSMEIRTALSR